MSLDLLKEELSKAVRRISSQTAYENIDYRAFYQCRILRQNENGNLDLRPDDARLTQQGFTDIPIRIGVAGTRVKVTSPVPGSARCLLGWENGTPTAPYVCGFLDFVPAEVTIAATSAVRLGGK